jgi:hypothetical protein
MIQGQTLDQWLDSWEAKDETGRRKLDRLFSTMENAKSRQRQEIEDAKLNKARRLWWKEEK